MLAYSIYSGLSFVVVMANKSVKNALIRFSGLIGLLIAFLLEDHPGWLGNQGQEILFLGLSVFVTLSLFFRKKKSRKNDSI